MEGLYLMHTREFIKSEEKIYKLGRSFTLDNRVKQYPNGSNTLLIIACENSIVCESKLLEIFKTKFIQKKYYGNEYFEGDYKMMIREIFNYIDKINIENDGIAKIEREKTEKEKKKEKIEKLEKEKLRKEKIKKEMKEITKLAKEKDKIIKNDVVNVINVVNVDSKIINKCNTTCPKCKDSFKYKSILIRHLKNSVRCKCSNEEIISIINKPSTTTITSLNNTIQNKNIFICNNCNSDFKYKTSLYKHKRISKCAKLISK